MTIPDVPDPNADLADIRQHWLAFCSHDTGLPYPCICPTEDHRPVIAALVGEVETLRAEVARLGGERNAARARANEAARLSAEARDQADDLRRVIADLREQVAIIDESRTDMLVVQLRLEAERDEAQALLRLAPHHQQQVETLEYELVQARAEVVRVTADLTACRHAMALPATVADDLPGAIERTITTLRESTRKAWSRFDQVNAQHKDTEADRDEALGLLDELADDDPCDYDHHDYCQTHHLLSRPCANARAIALIAAVDQMAAPAPEILAAASTATGHTVGCMCPTCDEARRLAADQMAPSTPPSTPESDGQGEVAVTDAVEGSGGAEACPHRNRCPSCRCVLDAGHDGDHDVHCGNGGPTDA